MVYLSKKLQAWKNMLKILLLLGIFCQGFAKADHSEETTGAPMTMQDTQEGQEICMSKHCISASNRLFQYMDDQADPCQDFNQFACGGFLQKQVIPDDESRWNVFDILTKEVEYQGKRLLEAPIDDKNDFEAVKKAKKYYKSCMNEELQNDQGVEPLLKLLGQAGGWPVLEGDKWSNSEDFNPWDQSVKLLHLGYSNDYIATAYIYIDAKNNSHRVIYFDKADLGLSKEYWDKGLDEPEVQAYKNYMLDTAMLLGADETRAKQELEQVIDFEMKLAQISASKEDRRNKTKLYNPTTLGEFPTGPGLPESWTKYAQDLLNLEGLEDLNVQANEKVIIYDVNFYKNLSSLLSSTDQRTLANYLGWRLASSSMTYLNNEARIIRQKYRKALTGLDQAPPTWKRCIKAVGFNSYSKSRFLYAVSSMYAQEVFDIDAKKEVVEMTDYLRQAFKQLLDDLEWMDDETKLEAHEKLKSMKQFLAFPDQVLDQDIVDQVYQGLDINEQDYLENYLRLSRHFTVYWSRQLREPVDPNDWRDHAYVALVNAFYNPSLNNFEFPAGILQGTFFNRHMPKYLNYGGIGFIIGHEITHGFDDQGRQRNSQGSLVDWWKPETNNKFRQRAQCIVWQYGNYTSKQVELNVNGVNTQGENIADNGGLKEAYLAYGN